MKFTVEIPEVHKAIVEVEVADGTKLTRAEMIEKATAQFEADGSEILEYSHTIDDHDQWTVRTEKGDFVT